MTPEPQIPTVEQAIATKLHELYDMVEQEAKTLQGEDRLRHGLVNSIAVLLRQPVEVADRIAQRSGR